LLYFLWSFQVESEKNKSEINKWTERLKRNKFYSYMSSFLFSNPSTATSSSTSTKEQDEYTRKQQMIAVGVVLVAFLLHAVSIGLIKIDVIKSNLEIKENS
jgi:hypothetical protein